MKFFVYLIGLGLLLTLTACEDEHEHHHDRGGAYYGPEYRDHDYGHGGYRDREFHEHHDDWDHY